MRLCVSEKGVEHLRIKREKLRFGIERKKKKPKIYRRNEKEKKKMKMKKRRKKNLSKHL